MRQEDPRWGELVTLMGWPWKLALALMVSGAALLLLPQTGFAGPAVLAWGDEAALACITGAALLALGSGLYTLRALLRSAAEEPVPNSAVEAQDLIGGLHRLLEEQRLQVHEATGAVSRAVATAAQLSGLANSVEKQFRQTLEHAGAAAAEAPPAALPEATLSRIEACAQQMEVAGGALAALPDISARLLAGAEQADGAMARLSGFGATLDGLPQATAQLAAGMERVGWAAERLETATQALGQLPESALSLSAAAQGMAEQINTAQLQSGRMTRMSQRMEGLLTEALQRLAEAPAQSDAAQFARLEEVVHRLSSHADRILRNEANLGDAARYLSETTDRFAAGTAALETHAVRLQAMISIIGQREEETEPLREELAALKQQLAAAMVWGRAQPLSPAPRAVLERLGAAEADAAQLLQDVEALSHQALPPALASRATELLQAVQENIRRLHATAATITRADDGPAQAAA
ncbi:hypothetical protein QMO56_20045 [Roseomonas sp. E05]|uniref:hypothetical protein n=1 Tax=Roseomonas sp. E05 TaxID=3046310 RepID=UPI0024B94B6C|nr:hypothetical protein [Roseomonas sp. E05]MDJ0390410.1 hypothetical protein [Roseomonas sp. E05]